MKVSWKEQILKNIFEIKFFNIILLFEKGKNNVLGNIYYALKL